MKIFGERNTSTNALRQLIESNSASRVLPSMARDLRNPSGLLLHSMHRFGWGTHFVERLADRNFAGQPPAFAWKHAATYFDDLSSLDGALVVFCVRHPASWLRALYRSPYHVTAAREAAPDLTAFLCTEVPTFRRENLGGRPMHPAALFNAKLTSYGDFMTQLDRAGIAHQTILFEDFAVDQRAVFSRLAPFLHSPQENPTLLEKSTKGGDEDAAYYADFYGKARWRDDIPDPAWELIDREIDWDLAARFGYRRDV
ncbi:hypothetical protein [Aliiruegeria haliotis]|uniref:hypothetical protein n=1 Tax=Aliiruegeria haliotis TaxID=1280846 RepID=UPI0011B1EBF7|nr:hypothetical protein [Aliiruegeria haliotis]